jgi:hypothetical protein
MVTIAVAAALVATPAAFASATLTVKRTPLTVSGTGFKSNERVRLVVTVGGRDYAGAAKATASGSFSFRFAGVRPDRCAAISVRAVGLRGSKATAKFQAPECSPQ